MKVLVLRGGSPRRRGNAATGVDAPGARAHATPTTRDRGVLALGNGDGRWVLLNVSPAVAHQLDNDALLERHPGLPDAQVRAVLLTDAQVDHVGGLLSLRDGAPIDLYATPAVFEELTTTLPVLPLLRHYCGVHWHVVPVAGDRRVASFHVDDLPTLEFTALATQAPCLPHATPGEHPRVGDSIALAVRDLVTGQRLFCAPGLAQPGAIEFDWMREADCLLVDSPEPVRADEPPWVELMSELPARYKVMFAPAAADARRKALAERGIALAYDGMQIEL